MASSREDEQLDLKHLAPISIADNHISSEIWLASKYKKYNNLNFPILKRINTKFNFDGVVPNKTHIFSDYYKYNPNKHFVWTNKLVVKLSPTVYVQIAGNPLENVSYDACENPDESFYLKSVGEFGLGLFAKHDIDESCFNYF